MLGYHGINGIGPETSNHLLQIYVTPRLIYRLEALCLSLPEICSLEEYYRNNLRQLQFLHPTTAKVAIYLAFITFLDASKCFDVVDHNSMLRHLYDQGVHGKNWQLFETLYSNISSRVKWKNEISNSINDAQDI